LDESFPSFQPDPDECDPELDCGPQNPQLEPWELSHQFDQFLEGEHPELSEGDVSHWTVEMSGVVEIEGLAWTVVMASF
jgi:hypothetical protein